MLDVYSFGVVLFEILSGREAIMRGALTLTEDFSSSNARPKDEQRALVTYVCASQTRSLFFFFFSS